MTHQVECSLHRPTASLWDFFNGTYWRMSLGSLVHKVCTQPLIHRLLYLFWIYTENSNPLTPYSGESKEACSPFDADSIVRMHHFLLASLYASHQGGIGDGKQAPTNRNKQRIHQRHLSLKKKINISWVPLAQPRKIYMQFPICCVEQNPILEFVVNKTDGSFLF